MAGHTHVTPDVAFWPLSLIWVSMMAAMMAPTAWPWVGAFHRINAAERGGGWSGTARFAAGYLVAWFAYAIGAALLQRTLQRTSLMAAGDVVVPWVAGGIFVIAGLYQFAPTKRACLTHCRTPLGYFLAEWRNGPMAAFRMGLHHGLFCVGCCWAMMATAFAVGVMNVGWMVALSVLALAEQVAPYGQMLRRAVGFAFLVAGSLRLIFR